MQDASLISRCFRCLLATWILAGCGVVCEAAPLLPDLIAWEDAERGYMHDGLIDTFSNPTKVFYRFTLAIPNLGDGPFEVFEVTHPDKTQDIYQHIYDSEGGFAQVFMGSFPNAEPSFGHLFLVGLAQYNLREYHPNGEVGATVATTSKTSHALVDSVQYDPFPAAGSSTRIYDSIHLNPLGVSVGWADLYGKWIAEQRIDVTGLPSGRYWLEVVIDPDNIVQEIDETNNITRVPVQLSIPSVPEPGMGGPTWTLIAAVVCSATRTRRSRKTEHNRQLRVIQGRS